MYKRQNNYTPVGYYFSYEIDKDGNYTFEEVGNNAAVQETVYVDTGVAKVKASSNGATYGVADNDTVLTVIPFEYKTDGSFKAVKSVTSYTGYKNFPKDQAYTASVLLVYDDDGYLTNVYVMGHEEEETTTVDVAVYLGSVSYTHLGIRH